MYVRPSDDWKKNAHRFGRIASSVSLVKKPVQNLSCCLYVGWINDWDPPKKVYPTEYSRVKLWILKDARKKTFHAWHKQLTFSVIGFQYLTVIMGIRYIPVKRPDLILYGKEPKPDKSFYQPRTFLRNNWQQQRTIVAKPHVLRWVCILTFICPRWFRRTLINVL